MANQSLNAEVGNWLCRCTETEMEAFNKALEMWPEKGIRTMQAFLAAASEDPAIAAALPESLQNLLGLNAVLHLQVTEAAEQAAA